MPLIDIEKYPRLVIDGLAAATARDDDWTANEVSAVKDALVEYLIEVQGSRCAYCIRLIKNEIGHRELDHILPAGKAGRSAVRAKSNSGKDRRVTKGYPAFRFEPKNLILTCKRCNHRKGSYDCRMNRSAAAATYPAAAIDFEWVHPMYHDFNAHITLLNEFVYQEVPGSNGAAVIDACKLAGIEALEARARELRLKNIKDVNKLVLELLLEDLPDDDIVDSTMQHFPQALGFKIRKLVQGFRENRIV